MDLEAAQANANRIVEDAVEKASAAEHQALEALKDTGREPPPALPPRFPSTPVLPQSHVATPPPPLTAKMETATPETEAAAAATSRALQGQVGPEHQGENDNPAAPRKAPQIKRRVSFPIEGVRSLEQLLREQNSGNTEGKEGAAASQENKTEEANTSSEKAKRRDRRVVAVGADTQDFITESETDVSSTGSTMRGLGNGLAELSLKSDGRSGSKEAG